MKKEREKKKKKKKRLENIKKDEENLEDIKENEDEFKDIEQDEETKLISKQLKKISVSDGISAKKITIKTKKSKKTPTLEKITEIESYHNLEEQIQDSPIERKEEIQEINYTGENKEENNLYGTSENKSETYTTNTKITRFDKNEASAFDSDGLRKVNYNTSTDIGMQQEGIKDAYGISNPNTRIKRFDKEYANTQDSENLRAYEPA